MCSQTLTGFLKDKNVVVGQRRLRNTYGQDLEDGFQVRVKRRETEAAYILLDVSKEDRDPREMGPIWAINKILRWFNFDRTESVVAVWKI